MRRHGLLIVRFLMLALTCQRSSAGQKDTPLNVSASHRLECLMTQPLDVRINVYNGTGAPQTIRGEVADGKGNLVLTGDWSLALEEVKEGKVVSTRALGPKTPAAGKPLTLQHGKYRDWKWKAPIPKLVDHPGSYRFRVGLGERTCAGRLFRVVERPGTPKWISLTYTPNKQACFIGEPIEVHFVMKNNGKDEFHFEEGGDYRGATRHLRFAFTAENEKGEKATDPKPDQPCFGGLGMSDPHLKPGKTYEKKLPLLAYLRFPAPGKYTVKGYQAMGFGEPVKGVDGGWGGGYAHGHRFEIALRLPTKAEATGLLRSLIGKGAGSYAFSILYHPCYLAPLAQLVAEEKDEDRIEALVAGIGSIMTVESTRRLIALAQDERAPARSAALRHLSWRLPDPRDTGKARHDGPFHFYSSDARRRDVRASWDEAFRPEVRKVLTKGLESKLLDEVAACAYSLGALGETHTAELLAKAADRVLPKPSAAEDDQICVNQIASAASLLAQLGAKPVQAGKASSPGRLAVWANMVRTKREYRTGDWQGLLLHMMHLDSPVTRMAAIRWLPRDFAQRDQIPWKKLFGEKDSQIWWHAIQVAREKFPPGFAAVVRDCLNATQDQRKRRDFEALLKEIAQREEREQ